MKVNSKAWDRHVDLLLVMNQIHHKLEQLGKEKADAMREFDYQIHLLTIQWEALQRVQKSNEEDAE